MIMIITESWLNSNTVDSSIMMKNYSILRKDRLSGRGGGILIYYSYNINVSVISLEIEYEDSIWFEMSFGDISLCLSCVYRKPNQGLDDDVILMKNLELGVSHFKNNNFNDLLIIGDFNVGMIDWKNLSSIYPPNHFGEQLLDFIRKNYLIQNINFDTRFSNRSSSILDLLINSNPFLIDGIYTSPPILKSDHLVIEFTIDGTLSTNQELSGFFDFKNGDYNSINEELAALDIYSEINDINFYYNQQINGIKSIIGRHIKFKKIKKNSKKKPDWFNNIKLLKKLRKQLFNVYCLTKKYEDFKQYKLIRNKLVCLIRQSKRNYDMEIANKASKNINILYSHIKKSNRLEPKRIKQIVHNGTHYNSPSDIGNILGRSFAPDVSSITTHQNYIAVTEQDGLNELLTNEQEVALIITNCKDTFSSGPDEIPYYFIKKCIIFFSKFIAIVVNYTLTMGILPDLWKEAIILPKLKKGNRENVTSYRPICLTCNIGKIAERIILTRLNYEIVSKNLLSPTQHGFREGKSCTTNLLQCMNDWTTTRDKRRSVAIIYLDFSKAFDSVSHSILIGKLIALEVNHVIIRWISDFLNNRKIRVKVGESLSRKFSIKSGVPQGCVISAILFNLFIADIDIDITSSIISYADDVKIYREIVDENDNLVLQKDLDNICSWANKNQIALNENKCVILKLGNKFNNFSFSIKNVALNVVEEQKDLGIWIDSNLSFSYHVGYVIKKMTTKIGFIKRTFSVITVKLFASLYKSFIQPLIDNCSVAWPVLFKKDISRLNRAFRRFTKSINGFNNMRYEERIYKLSIYNIFTPEQRFLINDLSFVYLSLNNPDNNMFKRNSYLNTRGHKFKITSEICKTEVRKNYISNRVVNIWNNLPSSIIDSNSIFTFKKSLIFHLRELDFFNNLIH